VVVDHVDIQGRDGGKRGVASRELTLIRPIARVHRQMVRQGGFLGKGRRAAVERALEGAFTW
jgi:hypothetical protein